MGERPRGPIRWEPSTPRQVAILADVLERYQELAAGGLLPRGPRGVFYDLRPGGRGRGVRYFKRRKDPRTNKLPPLGPMDADVGTVQEIVALARRAGKVPESWVDDERAPDPLIPLEFADADEATGWVERVVDELRLERQTGQDVFVEVWCEAAGISGRLAVVADPYGVPVYAGGGFDGIKGKRDAARRAASRDVPTVALHVGDFDKHGRWIFKAKAEDVAAWVPSYVASHDAGSFRLPSGEIVPQWSGPYTYSSEPERVVLHAGETVLLDVRRLAVTQAQVDAGLVELDDDGKAEAEQLPADWAILTEALDELLDPVRREEVVEREEQEQERLRALLAERWHVA